MIVVAQIALTALIAAICTGIFFWVGLMVDLDEEVGDALLIFLFVVTVILLWIALVFGAIYGVHWVWTL